MDPILGRLTGAARGMTRRSRWLLGGAGLLVLLAIGAGVSALGSAGSTESVPVVATKAAAPATPSATPLLVQVVGAVRHPGVVSLAAGARTLDAVAAAGGPTASADEAAVDLAARVADGQRIDVPVRGAPAAAASTAASGSPISLSAATADQLATLPHIGPAMAARIIAYRDAHGGFGSVAELQQVSGIGPRTYADLKDLVVP